MNPEDQDYDQGGQDQDNDDRNSPQNPSRNPENRNRQNRQRGQKRRGKGIGNKIKKAVKDKIDPRERIKQLKNPKEILKRAQKDFFKNLAKEGAKKAAMSPWTWIIIGGIALIFFLILIMTGIDEEENKNCGGGGEESKISITMKGPEKAKVGDKLEYTITVSGSTGKVTVKDFIPDGTAYETSEPEGKLESQKQTAGANIKGENSDIVTWQLDGDGEIKLTLLANKDNTHVVNVATVDEEGATTGTETGGKVEGETPNASGDDYEKVQFRGVTVNNRTKKMLEAAEKEFGKNFTLTQGSYNKGGVAASAGTHDGGGVVDISVGGMNKTTIDKAVKALRKKNFAAWYRTPAQGFSPHIHAVAIGDKELSPGAKQQVEDYKNGKNGLAGGGKDDGPKTDADTGEEEGECAGKASGSGGPVAEGFVEASTKDCPNFNLWKTRFKNPKNNFGNPTCNFSKEKLSQLIKDKDSKYLHEWFDIIVKGETGDTYDPNAYNGNSTSGKGAYGLYQMNPKGKGNGEYDAGDVNWELQTTNAINYNKGLIKNNCDFWYWEPARKAGIAKAC